MSFFRKLFSSKGPEDHLNRGDGHFAAHSYYEARLAYEAGLDACRGQADSVDLSTRLEAKLAQTCRAMAELNLREAEHCLHQGLLEKAAEHVSLAKTLTGDADIREKADNLLASVPEKTNDPEVLVSAHSCSSCSGSGHDEPVEQEYDETDMPLMEHYELLIRQLPEEVCGRYADLGEEFASAFIAASHDRHQEALELLEKWFTGSERDIFYYEKGKLLHRMGRDREAEAFMREAIRVNGGNSLAHLGLALLLLDGLRFGEAACQLDRMIEEGHLSGQASLMRGELHQHEGETEAAFKIYCALLETPLAKAAAEKLYVLLLEGGRQAEANQVFKRYLGSCKH